MNPDVTLELTVVGEGDIAVGALELLRALLATAEQLGLGVLAEYPEVFLLHLVVRERVHRKSGKVESGRK